MGLRHPGLKQALVDLRCGPLAAIPVPCRLPRGGWFLAYGDEIGITTLLWSLRLGTFEEAEGRFAWRYVEPGMTCLDVGANQGLYTLQLARSVGEQGRVVAFEPVPALAARLRRNLALNHCRNVRVEPAAVGRAAGSADLYVLGAGKASYSGLRPSAVAAPTSVLRVPTLTLDGYVAHHRLVRVDFVKLDIEGGELDALSGAEQLLRNQRPVLLCELADVRTRVFGYDARAIYDYLAERRYRWFQADADGSLVAAPHRTRYEPDWANLIAVPEERLPRLGHLMAPAGHQRHLG